MMPGLKRTLPVSFDVVLARVVDALATEGFGVLTQIDVRDTFEKKLGVAFRRYKILGACNPHLAHRALSAELDIGLMLPCNLIVYELDDGHTVVAAVDPLRTVASEHPALQPIAAEVHAKLTRVLGGLEPGRASTTQQPIRR